jgi:hypothetical protein
MLPTALTARACRCCGDHLPLLPAGLLVLLPKCPLCLAAWLGIFGSVGGSWLGHLWGTPIEAGLLSLALGALALRARRIHDLRPLSIGLLGATALLAGRHSSSALALLLGLCLLTIACVWSSRETRIKREEGLC